MPILGHPGSLKSVFGGSVTPRDSATFDDYVDEIVPDQAQCSILGSNVAFGRRSRLDDSAGEGLRRNVLVRNAMLSSLERERRQMVEEASAHVATVSASIVEQNDADPALDEEAQFFEDLLSELSGSESSSPTSSIVESSARDIVPSISSEITLEEKEDFVHLDLGVPTEYLASPVDSPRSTSPDSPVAASVLDAKQDEITANAAPALASSCSSTLYATLGCADSGFAEESSRPPSAASCCTGYPNVCPYPATSSYAGGSSEELPALIDDDSDVEDDDDDEVDHRIAASQELGQANEAAHLVTEQATLFSSESNHALSRPLSPVLSPVHSMHTDFGTFRDPLSPEPSRPTSPISSSSSKGDGDGPSPVLLPSDLGALPSLAELSLQLPAAAGASLLSRPSRAFTGTWFEHKQEAPGGPSAHSDRMRWTTSPATYFRPLTAAAASTAPDFQHPRFGIDSHRSSLPTAATNDPTDHSIVVHWSR